MKRYIGSVVACLLVLLLGGCAGSHHRGPAEGPDAEAVESDYSKLPPLRVKFYLERSGSMTPYDAPQGDGSFKKAIVSLLNALPGDKNQLFIVNDGIHPYPKGIRQFVESADIFASTKGIGNPAFTDFRKIFDALLNQTRTGEVSVLVSDMIYSVKGMTEVNPSKLFADEEGMVSMVFKDAARQKSMLVVQLSGAYNGPYYTYDAPSAGRQYDGRRPYYILVVGTNADMRRLGADARYAAFRDFKSLAGYRAQYLFARDAGDGGQAGNGCTPFAGFLMRNADIEGRFRLDRDDKNTLTDVRPDDATGRLRLALAVDLDHLLVPESWSANPANYTISGADGLRIVKIRRIDERERTNEARPYMGTASHIIVLEARDLKARTDADLALGNLLPPWVAASSTDDDSNLGARRFATTTFGFAHLMQAVYDSYAGGEARPSYFKLHIRLEK